MSAISSIRNNYFKELTTATLGAAISAASIVALQYLSTARKLPLLALNLARYTCFSTSLVGAVLGFYGTVRLYKKATDKTNLQDAIKTTAFGILVTSAAHSASRKLCRIAPSFSWRKRNSMAYCIATNFGLNFSTIVGMGGLVFTGYAACRAGKAALEILLPAPRRSEDTV